MNHFRPQSGFSDRGSVSQPLMKMRLETELVRKREAETRRCETARSNNRYFQHWAVQNEKFDDWTSPKSARLSSRYAEARETDSEIEERRRKLRDLYLSDKKKEELALKKLKEEEEARKYESMKDKVYHFRMAKSRKAAELAEQSQHESWKASSGSYRAFESELKRQQQTEVWERQLREKEGERLRQLEEKKMDALEAERAAREEEQRIEAERGGKLESQRRFKKELDEQMALLKAKDKEAEEKRREVDRLYSESLALEAAKDELRRKEEERTKKKLNSDFLTKQHLALLRQRSREVASDLEAEMHRAQKLFPSDEIAKDSREIKEKERQDIQRYLHLVEHHRKLEKERLQQTDFLFQEEAKKMWEKREKEWDVERMARQKLMEEVITTQKRQIEEKMMAASEERDQILKEREEIFQAMEVYDDQMKSSINQSRVRQEQTKAELIAQIEGKRERLARQAVEEERERQEKERAEIAREEKHWSTAMQRLNL